MKGLKNKVISALLTMALTASVFAPMAAEARVITSGDDYIKMTNGMEVKLTVQMNGPDGEAVLGDRGQDTTAGTVNNVFDGDKNTIAIYRKQFHGWGGVILVGDYIQVEFKDAISLKDIAYSFENANNSFDSATLAYTTDGETWVELATGIRMKNCAFSYVATEAIQGVKAVRLISETEKGNNFITISEIFVNSTVMSRSGYDKISGLTAYAPSESNSEGAGNGYASSAVDGNVDTHWHTAYDNGTYDLRSNGGTKKSPYNYIEVTLPSSQDVAGVSYLPRQLDTGYTCSNGAFAVFKVQVQNADSTEWTDVDIATVNGTEVTTSPYAAEGTEEYAAGYFVDVNYTQKPNEEKELIFKNVQENVNKVRFVAKESYASGGGRTNEFMNAAELYVLRKFEKSIELEVGENYTEKALSTEIRVNSDEVVKPEIVSKVTGKENVLFDHKNDSSTVGESFSTEVSNTAQFKDAEFTFIANGNNWEIYNIAKKLYLVNDNANSYFSNSATSMKAVAVNDDAGNTEFRISKTDDTRYLMFYYPKMNFNSNSGGYVENYENTGSQEMVLLERHYGSQENDVILGYKRANEIVNGNKYLIAQILDENTVIVLYPENGTSDQTKLVGEGDALEQYLSLTALNPGYTTVEVGNTWLYNVKVKSSVNVSCAEDQGTVSSSASTVVVGDNVTLTATAAEGYRFVQWETEDGTLVSRDAECMVTIVEEGKYSYVAKFKANSNNVINVLPGLTLTDSILMEGTTHSDGRPVSYLNDGDTNKNNYLDLKGAGTEYRGFTIDLGKEYAEIDSIKLLRYHDNRVYRGALIQVANQADFSDAVTVYCADINGNTVQGVKPTEKTYPETSEGRTFVLPQNVAGRYVRFLGLSNGTAADSDVHMVEFEVYVVTEDKTPLSNLVAEYANLNSADYTAESWTAYEAVLAEANALLAQYVAANEGEVAAVCEKLTAAKDALESLVVKGTNWINVKLEEATIVNGLSVPMTQNTLFNEYEVYVSTEKDAEWPADYVLVCEGTWDKDIETKTTAFKTIAGVHQVRLIAADKEEVEIAEPTISTADAVTEWCSGGSLRMDAKVPNPEEDPYGATSLRFVYVFPTEMNGLKLDTTNGSWYWNYATEKEDFATESIRKDVENGKWLINDEKKLVQSNIVFKDILRKQYERNLYTTLTVTYSDGEGGNSLTVYDTVIAERSVKTVASLLKEKYNAPKDDEERAQLEYAIGILGNQAQ